jgi:RHS repeat-associated protein
MGCEKLQYETKLTLHRGGKSGVDTSLNLSRLARKSRVETGYYYYGARYYNPKIANWLSVDPLWEETMTPYQYVNNNPVNLIDPTGLKGESTHTDENGKVIAVFNDGDNGVYKHKKNKDGSQVTENQLLKRSEKQGSSSGGTKMGETEYWDEFVSPETGNTMTNYVIQFGKSFDPIIQEKAAETDKMNLKEIASESGVGGKFDIKVPYKNVGALLNGKYATSRSAGNYLAGYNAEGGSMFGVGISFNTFQKLAGALHVKGGLTNTEKANIVLTGKSYGPAPAYGEVMYQYRMSKAGWNSSKKQ